MTRLGVAALVAASIAAPTAAHAFCGFYVAGGDQKMFNDATQVVLMRQGTRTVLSMQNNYKGPPEAFAMVVPVPVVLHEGDVKTLPKDVFAHVEQMGAPRLVEYNVLILSAQDSTGLETWLRQEKYTIPNGAEPLLRQYVESGLKFFVAK